MYVAPTRDLLIQSYNLIREIIRSNAKLSSIQVTALYGGTPIKLSKSLMSKPVHILFATPGRLRHAAQELGLVTFEDVRVLVLDEMQALASQDFQRQLAPVTSNMKAQSRQPFITISFGTYYTERLKAELRQFAYYREDPKIARLFWNVHQLEANQLRFFLTKTTNLNRRTTLCQILRKHANTPIIIYARTKKETSDLVSAMQNDIIAGSPEAESRIRSLIRAHHANLSQREREENISGFLTGEVAWLVTSIPSTGLNFPNNPTIIQYQLPAGPSKEQAFSTW
jgi:superfamily II DNA/RNA helicase